VCVCVCVRACVRACAEVGLLLPSREGARRERRWMRGKKNRGEGEPPSPLARAGADLLLAFFLLARRRGAPRGPWWARKGARNGRPPSQAPALGSGGRPRGGAGARGAHAKGAPSEVPRALLTLGACSLHSALPSPPSHPPQSAPHTAPGAGQVDHQDGWAGSGWAWRAEAHRGRPLGPPSRGPSFFFPTSVCARPSQPSNFPSPPRAPRAAFIPLPPTPDACSISPPNSPPGGPCRAWRSSWPVEGRRSEFGWA